jgi:hypothetical protein
MILRIKFIALWGEMLQRGKHQNVNPCSLQTSLSIIQRLRLDFLCMNSVSPQHLCLVSPESLDTCGWMLTIVLCPLRDEISVHDEPIEIKSPENRSRPKTNFLNFMKCFMSDLFESWFRDWPTVPPARADRRLAGGHAGPEAAGHGSKRPCQPE